METAGCHVILMNAINQSGLMDKYNHSQRFKVIQVIILLCQDGHTLASSKTPVIKTPCIDPATSSCVQITIL